MKFVQEQVTIITKRSPNAAELTGIRVVGGVNPETFHIANESKSDL